MDGFALRWRQVSSACPSTSIFLPRRFPLTAGELHFPPIFKFKYPSSLVLTRRFVLLVEGHRTFPVEGLMVMSGRRPICNSDIFSNFLHPSKHFPAWLYLPYFWPIRPIYCGCRIQEPTNCPPRMLVSTSRETIILWHFYSTPALFCPKRF